MTATQGGAGSGVEDRGEERQQPLERGEARALARRQVLDPSAEPPPAGSAPRPRCTTNARCAESVDPCSSRGVIGRSPPSHVRRSVGASCETELPAPADGSPGEARGLHEEYSGDRRGAGPHEAIANRRRARGPDRGRERVGVVRRAALAADAEDVRRAAAPRRSRGAADHEGGAAHRGLARRRRERGRADQLHSRSAQGARRFADAPRYIETVHRRGFRFIGPIGEPATCARVGSPPTRRLDRRPRLRPRRWSAGRPSSRGFTSCWGGRWPASGSSSS